MYELHKVTNFVFFFHVDQRQLLSLPTADFHFTAMSEKLKEFIEIPQQFVREGNQFITRCTKPSQKEFLQICKAVAIGFAVMGFIGYFVKLIHIPINNILVGGA